MGTWAPENYISSVELINKTGISRATLNNYIKLGIIAKPIIQKPKEKNSKTKRIGYFEHAMLQRIIDVLAMKKNGLSILQIVSIFKNDDAVNIEKKHPEPSLNNIETLPLRSEESDDVLNDPYFNEKENSRFSDSIEFHSFSVVVAKLKEDKRLSSELSSTAYASIIEHIWKSSHKVVEKYNGILGSCTENRLILFFLGRNGEQSYVYESFCAAMELKKLMQQFENTFKTKGMFSNDMHLDIGVIEGYGFLKKIYDGKRIIITDLGNTAFIADSLADFSRHGSIWTNKSAIEMLCEDEVQKVGYGVREKPEDILSEENIVEKRYIRLIDRIDISHPDNRKYLAIAVLPIAEIYRIIQ